MLRHQLFVIYNSFPDINNVNIAPALSLLKNFLFALLIIATALFLIAL